MLKSLIEQLKNVADSRLKFFQLHDARDAAVAALASIEERLTALEVLAGINEPAPVETAPTLASVIAEPPVAVVPETPAPAGQ